MKPFGKNLSERALRWIRWHEKLINFTQKHLNDKQFVIISGVLIGITSALAAILLKGMVFYINGFLFNQVSTGHISEYLYALFPMVGIVATAIIVKYRFRGNLGGGNSAIIYAIKRKESKMPFHLMYAHIFTSAITVGTGGSTGLETPIVTTGAAIGSNYGKTYKVKPEERTIMLACGVAAGIAATFNAPIAGVLFAIEVLISEISVVAFIPILIAAASGAILSDIILNENVLLSFDLLEPFNYRNVPFYVLLGLVAGVVSVYYIRMFIVIESLLKRVKQKYYLHKAIIGGLLLGGLILLFPPLFGEGYIAIKNIADLDPGSSLAGSILDGNYNDPWALILFSVIIMLLKVIATGITLGSGGNGGNFAPSLFTGAYLGYVFASIINLTGLVNVPVSNFTIVAMAGILSGIFHAPLTAIFLIAEVTGGYDLIVPLMIVSALSFAVSKYLFEYPLDGVKLRKMLLQQ
ncbi:MAG TPA: chloride channel protein [Chitinophagales bacterium]|nr:chloride channel protein [Chitinophagales bacterium]HRG29287.1 chloride channel protein [Chitinophagales bacterium]HRG84088.1 chloride channel protein [Chitinophagales bacterium]HRH52346.1 chloride channel protein [Chitinophagales bacterium]